MSSTQLIKMRREEPSPAGGPVAADVHPAEVRNYEDGGWQVDREAAERADAEAKAKAEAEAAEKARAEAEAAERAAAEARAAADAEAQAAAEAKAAAEKAEGELSAPQDGAPELKLEDMKRPQLAVVAEQYGVRLTPGMSNAQAVEAIKAAAGYRQQPGAVQAGN